jgi:hypothetical protein
MSDCQFTAEYFDYENNKNLPFRCREVALDTGFCMFHDEIYYTKNKQEVLQCFMDKLKKAIDNNEVLRCVGYNIPEDVHLTNKRFSRPIYFSKARFYGKFTSRILTFIKKPILRMLFFMTRYILELSTFIKKQISQKLTFKKCTSEKLSSIVKHIS